MLYLYSVNLTWISKRRSLHSLPHIDLSYVSIRVAKLFQKQTTWSKLFNTLPYQISADIQDEVQRRQLLYRYKVSLVQTSCKIHMIATTASKASGLPQASRSP